MVRLDYRSIRQRSVLRSSDPYGRDDVFVVENHADSHHRSAAGADDEVHAHRHGRNVYDYSVSQWTGSVYSDPERCRDFAAVVSESDSPPSRPRQALARQEVSAGRLQGTLLAHPGAT